MLTVRVCVPWVPEPQNLHERKLVFLALVPRVGYVLPIWVGFGLKIL